MNKPLILVAGGAGYIGSHMVKRLRTDSFNVLVLDNFTTGFRASLLGAPFIEGSIGDATFLEQLFSRHPVEAVINFASLIAVGESVQKPDLYYRILIGLAGVDKTQLNTFFFCPGSKGFRC